MKPIPIWGECALYSKKQNAIIIADVHIGIEFEYKLKGVNIDIQTDIILKRCISLIKKYSADTIVIVGDIQHTIFAQKHVQRELLQQEHREINYFLKALSELVDTIHIIKGNHDGLLKSNYAEIHAAPGIKLDETAFTHGHSWPSASIVQTNLIIMGHIHPHIRLLTGIGYTHQYPCWLRGNIASQALRTHYRNVKSDLPFIVMPAFNPLCGGAAVNRDQFKEALFSAINFPNVIAYTLEGVNLGRIRHLR